MPLICSVVLRHITHTLIHRDSSMELRPPLKKLALLFLLSLLTTIIVNILLPNIIYKTLPLSISLSSHSLLTSNPYLSSADITSIRFFRQHDYKLSCVHKQKESVTRRICTKEHLQQNNISYGK